MADCQSTLHESASEVLRREIDASSAHLQGIAYALRLIGGAS